MDHTKVTPGPWKAQYSDYGREIWYGGNGGGMWTIDGPQDCHLAGMAFSDPMYSTPEEAETAKANAIAISMVPEMLEVVRLASDCECQGCDLNRPCPASRKARAILEKFRDPEAFDFTEG